MDEDLASHGHALLRNVAQAQHSRRASLGGILELDQTGIDPAAATSSRSLLPTWIKSAG